ncbi:MAG: Holliday junction branch migration protein RuvA [Bacillota bacterium]|jgi:Holliday junction DNA helicase RuvA|nr:Holliday junction branch migration protein RuvA [Bacillota bacterium]NLU54746.1 Holliday junction branch migration protein RuvA [Bacillota bacterium]HOA90362.1 Holliday junction branch migration protein RuvA [Bacillota bacterium]HOL13490.1 Holliday junction branch migration protein RuvA [Bacillota bacterium]HOP53691.1 Holliday junction branch migration protein RuvA [Bacillota bacterium]
MIGRVSGVLLEIEENKLLVDVGGVGFNVMVADRLATKLQLEVGKKITLLIETVIREDDIALYGFLDREEKECFKLISSVSGMGPKLALKVLSVLSVPSFYQAIVLGDQAVLTQVSGVGKKTAQRLILELKDKVSSISTDFGPQDVAVTDFDEVNAALQALGFDPQEYLEVANDFRNAGYSNSDIIKLTLKELGRGRGL